MTESEKKQILTLYESGMPISHIRKLIAMPTSEYTKAIAELKKIGELPKRKKAIDKVAEAYANGETNPYAISEKYGISYNTVRSYKAKLGIVTGRPPRNYHYCDRTNAITQDLIDGNMNVAQIAKKHDVCWQTVKKIKNRLETDKILG